jgi:hypothetical protein
MLPGFSAHCAKSRYVEPPVIKSALRITTQAEPATSRPSSNPRMPVYPHNCLAPKLPTARKARNQQKAKRDKNAQATNNAALSAQINLEARERSSKFSFITYFPYIQLSNARTKFWLQMSMLVGRGRQKAGANPQRAMRRRLLERERCINSASQSDQRHFAFYRIRDLLSCGSVCAIFRHKMVSRP